MNTLAQSLECSSFGAALIGLWKFIFPYALHGQYREFDLAISVFLVDGMLYVLFIFPPLSFPFHCPSVFTVGRW